jgi:hypothetical protein
MTPEEAEDIILGIFKTAWDPNPAVYDDVPGNKPAGDVIWARATVKHATGRQSSLGNAGGKRRYTFEGTVTVQVFSPVGDGSTAGLDAAKVVLNAYEDARNPDVWFRDARLNEVGSSGAFDQINVLATFSYDDVR